MVRRKPRKRSKEAAAPPSEADQARLAPEPEEGKEVPPAGGGEAGSGLREEAKFALREEATAAKPAEDSGGEAPEPTVPLEQHQRLLAEFDNFRKRVERENQRTRLWARADLLTALLPCLDDFDRARESQGPKKGAFDREGILIIMDRLADVLQREGLAEIDASPGKVFDPEIHEAVLTVPSAEVPEGCVAQTLEKGYRIGERLLRAAKVAVARAPDSAPATRGE